MYDDSRKLDPAANRAVDPAGSADGDTASADDYAEDARLFYQGLEQRGELVDVDDAADLNALPPDVTHVRYPDGTVERRGFKIF